MATILKTTKKRFSARAGLVTTAAWMRTTRLRELLQGCLPKAFDGTTKRSYKKFCDLIMALVAGADCIDDMALLAEDPAFAELCAGKVYTPKAYGDFLRSFSPENILHLQLALIRFGILCRKTLFPANNTFFFDLDSTSNRQYAKKMEGVARNYQNKDCLDSLDVFDESGFQYFINVRPGNTHTSWGCEDVIHRLLVSFAQYEEKFNQNWRACIRGDRGYYKLGFVNASVAKGADLIVGVKQDEHHFPKIIGQIHNWRPTDPDNPDRILFYDGREVEIGTTYYRPTKDWARRLRYVVIRAQKPADPLFSDYVTYDYYAFATTYSEQLMFDEDVIFCYRERGQAENYIKENKLGLDMKHYPCLKLDANRAYALICAFAYNSMRLMSLANNADKPILSKKIRFQWINLPSLVARTGGNVVLKFMEHHYREMTRWFELIHHLRFEFI